MLHALTRRLHRFDSRLPVVKYWPGTRRISQRLFGPAILPLLLAAAARRRRRLGSTTFVGIAGSAGKTITKAMIGAVLGSRYHGIARRGSSNFIQDIASNVLAVRSGHQFCVVELSADAGPSSLSRPLAVLQPQIGVITNIGTDHFSSYGSREAIAAEKGRLIRELPEDGIAVLNADDPLVISMRAHCRAQVISYGTAADADVRAESVSATWPDRLSFDLVHDGERVPVQTRLCGSLWVSAALSAAAVGIAMKVPLDEIARSLGTVEPFAGRMSPVELPDGVTFIREDWKASLHTIPPVLEFLRTARAARKISVIGTISDYPGESRTHYVRVARNALEVSDLTVFVGPKASSVLRAKPADDPDRLRAYSTVKAASDFLATFLRKGDLVLLKGSNGADHLYRIALSRMTTVTCWRGDCRKSVFCNSCELVARDAPVAARSAGDTDRPQITADAAAEAGLLSDCDVLVGLGNPGGKYANTPHNIGYAVVDRIAAESGAVWREIGRAVVANVEWQGIKLCLLKPQTAINFSGSVLHELSEALEIEPARILLVYDDLHMGLGRVRVRMRGSDGGHLGVRSILDAFQSDQFRRVKIGVERPGESRNASDVVLRPFNACEEAIVATAIDEACSRLRELGGSRVH